MSHEKIEISDVTRENIVNKLIEPYYMDMIKTTIGGNKLWRTLGISLETSSKLMVALGGIFSFSAGFYHDDTLSFVSGSISCMSLALLQVASFSYKENKKQGEELNILLKKLNLDTVPSMVRSEDQTTVTSSRYLAPGPNSYGPNSYGPNSYGPNSYGPNSYGPNSYGPNSYGPNPYVPNSFVSPPIHYPARSLPYASPPPNIQRSNSFTRHTQQPINDVPINNVNINDEILQKLEELKEEEIRVNELKILQQKQHEQRQKEIAEFAEFTFSARNEIQNLEEAVGEKIINLSQREERIKEREKELNIENIENLGNII